MSRIVSTESVPMAGGLRVVVPASLRYMTNFVLREQGDWFEDEIRFVRSFVEPGMNIVDIGANYGLYTLTMAKLAGGSGSVWAFEPTGATAACLRKSIEVNTLTNIKLLQFGLSDHEGEAEFFTTPNSELNSLSNPGLPNATSETIKLKTLDGCGREFGWSDIDFIKLDAEGEESKILKAATRILTSSSPLVMFELKHGDVVNFSLIEQFRALGYGIYRLVPGLNLLIPLEDTESADPYLLNLFACKQDAAAQLEQRGLLALNCESLTELPPYSAGTAYEPPSFATVSPSDQQSEGFVPYMEVLGAWAEAECDKSNSRRRVSMLMSAMTRIRSMLDEGEQRPDRLMTFSRIALSAGERRLGVGILATLANQCTNRSFTQIAEELKEPFLPASPRFDGIDPEDKLGQWYCSALLEALVENQAYSAYFAAQGILPHLLKLERLDFFTEHMKTRLATLRQLMAEVGSAAN